MPDDVPAPTEPVTPPVVVPAAPPSTPPGTPPAPVINYHFHGAPEPRNNVPEPVNPIPTPQPNPPAPVTQPVVRDAAPAPQPSQDDDDAGGRGRPSAAQLRAEAAAERVAARQARERAEQLEAQLQEANARVETVRAEERSNSNQIVQRYRTRIIDSELRAAAVSEGIVDPDLIPLIDRSTIVIDDSDNVTGIVEAVAAYKAAKPMFFRSAEPAPAPPPGSSPGPAVPRATGSPRPAPTPAPATPTADNVRSLSRGDYRSRLATEMGKLRGLR